MTEPVSSHSLQNKWKTAPPKPELLDRKRVAVTLSRGLLRFVQISPRIAEPRKPRSTGSP
ncbi:MAG TPA: hypothetical protein VIG29_20850 [Vicinamibacteria bacterium]